MGSSNQWRPCAAAMAKTAAAKSKLYSRYGKELLIAAKAGVPDPEMNLGLKRKIAEAKANQVPADVIKRAIEKAKGGSVPALLWEILPQDEAALDRWIGVPELYRKATIKVRRDGILVDVLIYILNSGKPQNKPSAFYYSTLLEGYKAAGFDAKILKAAVRNEDPNASGE